MRLLENQEPFKEGARKLNVFKSGEIEEARKLCPFVTRFLLVNAFEFCTLDVNRYF